MSAFFELTGVRVAFNGHPVLENVDVTIERGETVAVVGPSGSGKTTFLRLLNGAVLPSSGHVLVDGQDLTLLDGRSLRAVRARVGFVHQDHSLVPNLRVSQNVFAGRLGRHGLLAGVRSMLMPARADTERAHGILERVGIPEKLFQRTDTLSGGQQQRVALARALFQEPSALLADEPVASVDPARSRDLIELLIEVARERDLTLVVSLHDLSLARAFFPRTVGLRQGRVAFDAPTDSISTRDFDELYQLEGLPSNGL